MSEAPVHAAAAAGQQRERSILVLGAGELGMAALRPLSRRAAASGAAVSVLLRPATIATSDLVKQAEVAELRRLGVALSPGDIGTASVAELANLFSAYDEVLSCIGFAAGRGTQLKLAHAALQSGVRRYFPWQFGVDYDVLGRGGAQDLFDEQLDVRDLLRSQDAVEWVIISTGMFTSFLFEPSFGVVDLEHNTVNALGGWDNQVTITTPKDIGLLTTEIVFAEPRVSDQVVHVAGDTISYGDLADMVDRVLERRVERIVWDVPMLERALAADPGDAMKKYRAVFAAGPGMSWPKETTFNHRNGFKVTSVEQWARANLGAPQATAGAA